MNNFSDRKLFIGEIEPGRWVALTKVAPYVCFEADSREALRAKFGRAAEFCQRNLLRLQEERIENIIPFHVKETILVKDLIDA
jgi:hypothetical protein